MAKVDRGYTFGATEQVTNAKLHALVDDATVSDIVATDFDSSMTIDPANIGTINGSSLRNLSGIISGAGKIPVANIDTGITANKIIILDGSAKLPGVDGSNLLNLPITALTIASQARGDMLYFNGTYWVRLAKGTAGYLLNMGADDPQWSSISALGLNGRQLFTTAGSNTFTAPTGITQVYVTLVGGGGGGGHGGNPSGKGGGGGGGACAIKVPIAVTAGSNYTAIVGAKGAGGTSTNGGDGGTSSFEGNTSEIISVAGGSGGIVAIGTANGAGGAGGVAVTTGSGRRTYAGSDGATGGAGGGNNFGNGGAQNTAASLGYGGGGGGGNGNGNGADGKAGFVLVEW